MGTRKVGAALAAIALVFVGCSSAGRDDAGSSPPPRRGGSIPAAAVHAASLERFDACPELERYLREESTKRVGPYGLPGSSVGGMVVAENLSAEAGGDDAAAAPAQRQADAAGGTFSGTNVQESSVDEPDTVKTNGRHIFTARTNPNDGRIRIVSVSTEGGRPDVTGTLEMPEGAGTELLLAGDRLLVLGMGDYRTMGAVADMAYPMPGGDRTIVGVVDVSDPAKMRVTDVVRLEGSYASARMVGGIARLVLNTASPERIELTQPEEPTTDSEKDALDVNKRNLRRTTIEDWLPRFKVEDASGAKQNEGPLASCASTYRPKTFSGFQMTSVVTIDPAKPDPRNSAAVLGAAGTVYASADNLYIATQNWGDPRPLPVDVRGAPDVAPIDPAKTMLHRFDIADPARAQYAASGEVRGTVLNQWSLSEHGGHLRVATTEDDFRTSREGVPSTKSYVTTFSANTPKLAQVGQVGNLGVGERIYGVRFIGDLGYVVTFRQVDPLHVIDLSDAAEPRVLGELKIPGYSAYLHPVGDGLLLGVGQDADPKDGGVLGTQLSLFDVKDPTAPKRIDQVRIDEASSPIEGDHHAFTWWNAKRLAIVPVARFLPPEPGSATGEPSQLYAAIGYRIGMNDIREVGRANHQRHEKEPGFAQIDRSIVIGDLIYTLSPAGIMSSDLDSFEERGWAEL